MKKIESLPVSSTNSNRNLAVMRYRRIEDILNRERAFRELVNEKTSMVRKRDGTPVCFSPLVVQVTHELYDSGQDPAKVDRPVVILKANDIVTDNNRKEAPSTKTAVPKRRGRPRSVNKVPKPKEVESIMPAKEAESILPANAPPGTVTLIDKNRALPASEANTNVNEVLPPHYNVALAISSLLLSASQLSAAFERTVGYRQRQQRLNEVCRMYEPGSCSNNG